MIFIGILLFIKSLINPNFIEMKNKKNSNTIEIIEDISRKYWLRVKQAQVKIQKIINSSENSIYILRLFLLMDKIHLYLLRNNLYRILNKSVLDIPVRKLVKSEILKAPEGTFTDFVKLYNDLKEELHNPSKEEYHNINYTLN
ncbi:MAG: hypothetical protein ACFFEN_10945 [Candidatus Thorarchaeota archaeon]